MTAATDSPVIVGYDGSPRGRDALALGEALAEARGARLLIAHAYPSSVRGAREADPAGSRLLDEAEQTLREARAHLVDPDRVSFRALAESSPARALHELAEEERADAVVLGSGHRGALGRVMAGGVAERLLHGAPCPVAVAPLGYADRPRPTGLAEIAAADDGDAEARLAVRAAVALAERTGARLTVIRVVPTATQLNPVPIDGYAYGVYLSAVREEAERELNETIDAVGGKVRARGLLLEGDPADEIAARSGTLDLLVLGSRGYGPVRRVLLGSVSTRVMRSADCPVLVVPRSGKEHMLEEVEPGSRAVNRE